MTWIGGRWKARKGWSRAVLMTRALRRTQLFQLVPTKLFVFLRPYVNVITGWVFNRKTIKTCHDNGGQSAGVHLFPFRTESLSPVAPMVLLSQAGESVVANLITTKPLLLALTGAVRAFGV